MSQGFTQSQTYKLSKDPETEGFDLQAGQTWVYPTNYPIREYQFNIIEKALLTNTLVSLPTGLGKTFIAAVVMYNFFRWYPMGKVIFMAPTRPLVKQQIDACYDIMAIPKEATAELTGTKLANFRGDVWKEKRVFFVTPQILQNDLETIKELGPKIKCVVFDEAHRARGNHAYCEVIRKLVVQNRFFRVLALSATPGSTITDVLEVVENLLIAHLEFRTEESLDVHPYVYQRNLTTVVVPLGDKLQKVKEDYLQILEYYTKTLMKYNIIQGNCGNLTKGKIFLTMKEFQRNRTSGSPNYAEIMKSLNICVTLYHAFELLTRHGLRSFVSFFNEHIDKPLLRGNHRLAEIVNDVKEFLGPEPNVELLPDGSYPEIPKTVKFGHPKFYKLRDILVSHFMEADDSSRVIVFFEYRNSVMEAYALLIQARPVLKPRIFLGQGQGVTQRLQLNVVKSFREGQCNVLLSTCIGEEGLDVGNVDLIVCFDISNKSPIRMVQRMGRTGRKKEGHVTVLVTEGKEQQILKDCLIHKKNIAFHVLSSKELARGLNKSSPRLVPENISPKCEKIYITVKKPTLTKKSSLKDMFRNASSSSSEPTFSPDLELIEIEEKIPEPQMLWNKEDPLSENNVTSSIFSKKIEKQRNLQPVHRVKHSKSSEVLVDLLKLVDSKRFNIPVSQIGTMSQLSQHRNMKQGDIRSMFCKLQDAETVLTPSQSSKVITTPINNVEDNNYTESKELFTEISNYLSIQSLNDVTKKCRHCPNTFDCSTFSSNIPSVEISWVQIDDSIFNAVTLNDIKYFTNSLTSKPYYSDFIADPKLVASNQGSEQDDLFNDVKITQLEKIAEKVTGNADISLGQIEESIVEQNENVDISFGDKSCAYEAPKTLDLLISKFGKSIIDEPEVEKKSQSKKDFESNPIVSQVDKQEILRFFKLDSVLELFEEEIILQESSQETVIYSPDIIDATFMEKTPKKDSQTITIQKSEEELEMSPVLCKYDRTRKLKNFPHRPNLGKLKSPSRTKIETPSKFTMNATKISSTPFSNRTEIDRRKQPNVKDFAHMPSLQVNRGNAVTLEGSPKKSQDKVGRKQLDIDDLVDMSSLLSYNGNVVTLETSLKRSRDQVELKQLNVEDLADVPSLPSCSGNIVTLEDGPKTSQAELDVDDICDLSIFGISPIKSKDSPVSTAPPESAMDKPSDKFRRIFSNTSPKKSFDIDDFCDLTSFGISNPSSQEDNHEIRKSVDKELITTNLPTPTQSPSRSLTINKSHSQSQLPITQLLSLINKDETNPNLNSTQKPVESLKNVTNDDNFNTFRTKCESLTKKSKLSLNRTTQPAPALKASVSNVKPKKKLNELFKEVSSNSDDEFEGKPVGPVFKRPKLMTPQSNRKNVPNKRPAPVRKKKSKNVFIEDEAELSEDENVCVSEDEDDEDQNAYDASFVADETQHIDTQMHARYLQSIRSPSVRNRGQFKIPDRPRVNVTNVFSQEVNRDDTYLDDSFVVEDEEESVVHELSELEILELKLKELRKSKRKISEDDEKSTKRRRIIQMNEDSD